MTTTIAFGYPRRGLAGDFNTIRLGLSWVAKCEPGAQVELICSRSKKLLKRATVVSVHTGTLLEMASLHAHQAHNWKEHPEADRSALLVTSMMKRYPPGRCTETSMVSVIYLKEEPECTPP